MSAIGGTKEVKLTEGLLHLIIMVQDYNRFEQSKRMYDGFHGGVASQWMKETEDFFNSLNNDTLKLYGLSKNAISFRKVMNYRVTPEMKSTMFAELPEKFTF